MERTTRVGVVGAGQIVENAHLPVLLNLPGVEVAWVTDANPRRAAVLSRMYGVPQTSLEEFSSHLEEVDICLLATPVGARAPYLDLCAERGKAVLAEKPFATSESGHVAYCSRFPPYALGVSFQRRFYASIRAIRSIVERRFFGDLQSITFAIGGFDLKSGGAGRYLGNRRLAGGGVVMDLGVHVLDQVLLAARATDVEVDSVRSILLDGMDFDAIVGTTLHCDHGTVRVSGEMTRLRPIPNGFAFAFERATVRLGVGPETPLRVVSTDGEAELGLGIVQEGAMTVGRAFFDMWSCFVRGLNSREVSLASATTSVLTARWVDRIYERMVAR